jgi:hypothetical protein
MLIGRWSQGGEYLLSGSDDCRLFIWSAYDNFTVRKVLNTGERSVLKDVVLFFRTQGKYILRKIHAPYEQYQDHILRW